MPAAIRPCCDINNEPTTAVASLTDPVKERGWLGQDIVSLATNLIFVGHSKLCTLIRCSVASAVLATGCNNLSDAELETLATMELTLRERPDSPTNRVADDPAAAELGRALFFDERMSSDGTISCASCHDPAEGWSDPRAMSLGVAERLGDRHSMPITAAALQDFLLWDGRADSLWSQSLKAIENRKEMDLPRADVARLIATEYADAYFNIFGEVPDPDSIPAGAMPGTPAWDALSEDDRDAIDTAFANVGKAIEAYERNILCTDTKFDRWIRGEAEFSRREEVGAARFLRDGCVSCHSGPAFSDGSFHNIGIGSGTDIADEGRRKGRLELLDDPFSGGGGYSDDPEFGGRKLMDSDLEPPALGAFRTPSLRGVGQRRSFGHRGHKRELEDFLDDVYDDPHMQGSAVGELDPLVRDVDLERERAMLAFLRTLNCPQPDPQLLSP